MKKRTAFLLFVACIMFIVSSQAPAQTGKYGVGTNAVFKGPVGLQLYSLREIFKTDLDAGLKQTTDFGFQYVELTQVVTKNKSCDEIVAKLAQHKLKAIAAGWSFADFEKDPEKVIREAKAFGVEYAGCYSIPHKRGGFTEAECRKAIEVFNRAGRLLAKEGIKLFYHNHGYEFFPYKNGTMFDLLVQETDPKAVFFELDVMWVIFPGHDPVALVKKYPGRFPLFHLKDLKKGVEGNLSGGTDVKNDVALGTGQADYHTLLKAAQENGTKYYFIEDESPDVLKQIPVSLKFLESVTW
ncbi:MAG: sugar phosphate isomerase/epimerase [Planctomycetia bacterium]|nr:sugar phosphate isomerase/epimerase [Planctomycetia bacterium]